MNRDQLLRDDLGDDLGDVPAVAGSHSQQRSPLVILAWVGGALALTVVGLFLAALVVLAQAGQKEADAKAGIELTTGGSYGSPLAAGQTAKYEDGVSATAGEARRIAPVPNDERLQPGELTYEFAVTYVNGSDKTVEVISFDEVNVGHGGTGAMAVLAVNAKDPRTDDDWFPENLAPGERVTVPLRFNVAAEADVLTFETHVTEEYREHVLWELPLRR
ncbi:hypothetical protein [Streptomyces sp. NPDC020681]|uniref:hypothetical protein n=1 Tax=Streptomyces sp. NPDC020681 TaxID=3365083 RepID=UPI0037A6DA59